MTVTRPERGDGIGIEVTRDVVRGVRLAAATPGRLAAAAEVPASVRADDRSLVDALARLRADLGDPGVPTRVAVFPPGATLSRVDATGPSLTTMPPADSRVRRTPTGSCSWETERDSTPSWRAIVSTSR